MFVVLTVVACYRHAYGADLRWSFWVYPPCIAAVVALAALLEAKLSLPCERWLRRP